jgi:hypothetical protein
VELVRDVERTLESISDSLALPVVLFRLGSEGKRGEPCRSESTVLILATQYTHSEGLEL